MPRKAKTNVDEWAEYRAASRADPAGWAWACCHRELWSRQRQIMEAVRDYDRVTVRSGNGVGKSTVAAAVVAWFFATMEGDTIILTTAPTLRQVRDVLWGEIHALVRQSEVLRDQGQLNQCEWRDGPRRYAIGLTTNETDRFSGYHADNILIVVDEASGIPEPIYEAIETVRMGANAKLLLIGNPIRPSGTFYESHKPDSGFERIAISSLETPNVVFGPDPETGAEMVPGMATRKWVEDQKKRWGETHPWYYAHVLGRFPETASNALLSLAAVEDARLLELPASGETVLGCDVARFGDDETVIVIRQGGVILVVETRRGQDTVQVAGLVKQLAEQWNVTPSNVRVDDTGVGGGVTDALRAQGLNVTAVNAAGSADDSEHYADARSESWYLACEAIKGKALSLANVPERLVTDLLAPTYRFVQSGAIRLEPKADIKKRIGRSPDYGDALALTYATGQSLPTVWVV